MKEDIVDKLKELLVQATTERSHYYVAKVVGAAIVEIERLREYEFRYKSFSK